MRGITQVQIYYQEIEYLWRPRLISRKVMEKKNRRIPTKRTTLKKAKEEKTEKRTSLFSPRKTGLSPWREYVFSLYRKKQETLTPQSNVKRKNQHEGETPNKKIMIIKEDEEEEKQKTNHRSIFLFS